MDPGGNVGQDVGQVLGLVEGGKTTLTVGRAVVVAVRGVVLMVSILLVHVAFGSTSGSIASAPKSPVVIRMWAELAVRKTGRARA